MAFLHYELLGGDTGRIVNGIGAVLLFMVSFTGMVLWWPGRKHWKRALIIRWSARPARFNWDLHTAGGFYASVFLLVLSFTGAYLCLPVVGQGLAVLTGGHAHDSETLFASTPSTSPEGAPDASLQQIMLQAGALRSGYRARFFELPQRKSDAVTVFLDDGSQERTGAFLLAGFDRRDGHLLQLVDARDFRLGLRLMLLLGPLHFGTFGGATTKILWVLLGLSPGALFFTGFFIWWRRVMRKRLVRASGASC